MMQEQAGGRNAQNDTQWELTLLEDGRTEEDRRKTPRHRLTVRVKSACAGPEYVWTGYLSLTPWGRCWLEEMRQTRSDGRPAATQTITTWFLVKEIRDPREAMRVVAAACRKTSLDREGNARTQARERREALEEVERILAEGAHQI